MTALELAKAKAIQVKSMNIHERNVIPSHLQMMESDEEDEGDAEFAVEISKQELVTTSLTNIALFRDR